MILQCVVGDLARLLLGVSSASLSPFCQGVGKTSTDTMKHVSHCASWVVGVDLALFGHRAFTRLCFFSVFLWLCECGAVELYFVSFFQADFANEERAWGTLIPLKQFSHERAKHLGVCCMVAV